MKNKVMMLLVSCLLVCLLVAGMCVSAGAAAALENFGLANFSAADGTASVLDGKTMVFSGDTTSKQDALVYKTQLSGEYRVSFDVSTQANAGTVFMAVLGNKSAEEAGGEAQIEKADALSFVVTPGAIDMSREGGVSASGYRFYNDTSYGAVTDPIKMGNAFGYFADGKTFRFELVVKANGDVDFYATILNVSNDYPQYMYTLSKTPDNAEADGTTDGYFAFVPTCDKEVTFSNFAVNGVYTGGNFDDDALWNVIGSGSTVRQGNAGAFLSDNERIVSDFYIDDSAVSDGDVLFDITYRLKPMGDHGGATGGWLTMGMLFGMDSKDAARAASGSIETQWATLVRVCEDGVAQTKVSGDGTGAASAWFVSGTQAIFRAVGKKGGTLDIYVAEGGNTLGQTVYQSYEGLDLNGYIAFYADDNTAVGGVHEDIVFTEIAVNLNPAAAMLAVEGVTCESTLSMKTGDSHKLQTGVIPSNVTNQNVSYISGNTDVVTVGADGVITAVGRGETTVTVTTEDGNFTAICNVTVVQPVTGVTLDKAQATLKEGDTLTLVATVAPADANETGVTFSSSDASVATVGQDGKVTAVKAGSATISVTTADGGFVAECEVTVVKPVTGVSLDKEEQTVEVGGNFTLIATVVPADASDKSVLFVSENSEIASVDKNGIVRGVAKGETTITVTTTDGGFTAECKVTVVQPVTGVTLDKTQATLKVGETLTLVVTVAPEDASDKTVTFSSSDTSIATVGQDGKVMAVKAGSATITVTAGGKTAVCTVTVEAAEEPGDDTPGTQEPDENTGSGCGASMASGTALFAACVLGAVVMLVVKRRHTER